MESLIEEFQLARRDSVSDMDWQLGVIEGEMKSIRAVQEKTAGRLTTLEARARAIKEKIA